MEFLITIIVITVEGNISRACQAKFGHTDDTKSFPPEQVYVVMMDLCPLWVHGRIFGRRLYCTLWNRMSDYCFGSTEQGHFTWLALALKQEVYVSYHMHQLLPVDVHARTHSAILDSLDPVYDGGSGQILWKAKFCLESFDMISLTGSVSDLVRYFSNPRPMRVDYLERTRRLISKVPNTQC